MAKLYRCDGNIIEVHPRKGATFSLTELQTYVGGNIQIVPLVNDLWVCNEDGMFIGMPININATVDSKIRKYSDYFVGDVLRCTNEEIE